MPRIPLTNRDSVIYLSHLMTCFKEDTEVKSLYILAVSENVVTNTAKKKFFKQWFLCALEKFNAIPQNNRMNKQKLYAVLFTYGFPMGLLSKVLLDGNLGPIRNAILLYKGDVMSILEVDKPSFLSTIGDAMSSLAISTSEGASPLAFYKMLLNTCYIVGGLGLARKLVEHDDIRSFIANTEREDRSRSVNNNPMTGYGTYPASTRRLFTELESGTSGERGVRRSGLTTSRDVVGRSGSVSRTVNDVVTLERGQNPSQPIVIPTTVLATEQGDSVGRSQSTTTESRTKIRDIKFDKVTFGIEIEGSFMDGVDSVGNEDQQWSKMRKVLSEADYTCDIIKSNGTKAGTGKLGLKREGSDGNPTYWKYKYDGSVYGGRPYEFASPILLGKNGIEQVKLICSSMRQAGFYSNATAGVHVHLGAKDLTLDHFKNICYNFTKFEPLIDMIFPSDRRWSNAYYSESFSKITNWVERIDRASTFEELRRNIMVDTRVSRGGGTTRYYAVNLFAYDRFGTVEFRKCMGTNDDRLIIFYTYFLFYMYEASRKKRLTNFTLKGLQDILPAWAYSYFVDKVRQTSGYDIKYGYDVGQGGTTHLQPNTSTKGGDPMTTPLTTGRGQNKRRTNNDFS
jgi:hypothetical protein